VGDEPVFLPAVDLPAADLLAVVHLEPVLLAAGHPELVLLVPDEQAAPAQDAPLPRLWAHPTKSASEARRT
jgi:hypothetical protein